MEQNNSGTAAGRMRWKGQFGLRLLEVFERCAPHFDRIYQEIPG